MTLAPPDGLVTVVHGDAREPDRLAGPEAPTPLAPWHAWLRGRYRPCDRPAAFRAALAAAKGPVIALLHADDRAALWGDDAAAWLAGPGERWLVLYSGGWFSWGACSRDEVLRDIGPTLPAEAWHTRWTAMPWTVLRGDARPLAWLGHSGPVRLPLALLSRRQGEWEKEACDNLIAALSLSGTEDDFLGAVGDWLRNGLLLHHLNAAGVRPRAAAARFRSLIGDGDGLWALEGLASAHGWRRAAVLLAAVRVELERLLRGRLDDLAWLDDRDDRRANRHAWQPTVEAVQALLDRP